MKPVREMIQFDDVHNLVIINGQRVSAEALDMFTQVTKPGRWFRIMKADGVCAIQQIYIPHGNEES